MNILTKTWYSKWQSELKHISNFRSGLRATMLFRSLQMASENSVVSTQFYLLENHFTLILKKNIHKTKTMAKKKMFTITAQEQVAQWQNVTYVVMASSEAEAKKKIKKNPQEHAVSVDEVINDTEQVLEVDFTNNYSVEESELFKIVEK